MHNNNDCKSSSISSSKLQRLEWVKLGRVTLEGDTLTDHFKNLIVREYGESLSKYEVIRDEPEYRHPSRSPEETPEYYMGPSVS